MKKETPRDLALNVLNGLNRRSVFSSALLDDLFRSHPDLEERDRAFISHLVQGVLRWRLRLDWIIRQASHFSLEKIDPAVLNILRLALYQVFHMDRVPESAAVNEAVRQAKSRGARHVSSFVNGLLRNVCRQGEHIPMSDRDGDPALYRAIRHSCPEWLVRKWDREWGPEFSEGLLSASNRIPTLTFRTNTLKIDRETLTARLTAEGVRASPTRYSTGGLAAENLRGRVDRLKSFREGLFQVQDEAAQIPVELLDPRPGERVLDVCAGLGGKTTHLAEWMGDAGHVVALDIHVRRLVSLERNAGRLGVHAVSPVAADASEGLAGLFRGEFDRILVDAPCSGLGVLSRHPDTKWNKDEADIHRLALAQKTILGEAVPLLRRGGRMLYVTCTLSREENEGVVEAVLAEHPGVRLQDLRRLASDRCLDLIDGQGFYRTFPHVHSMDGFFGALFAKN